MWCLILVLSIIMIISTVFIKDKDASDVIAGIGCIIFFIVSILSILSLSEVIDARDTEKQIVMYQEENAVIEQQISTLVENYMAYEGETLKEFSVKDGMSLISLYPELKSDNLVIKQMDIYTENNKQIKKLKERLIDVNSIRWWLYFGGK